MLSLLGALALGAPVLKYGIIFDAGSSGSRIHVYKWKTGGGGPKDQFDLISDDLLKIKPGLSAFKDNPSEAGSSLVKLIEHAKAKIPAELVSSTPMFLMATAGLRMVGEGPKDAILRSVCSYLSTTGFLFRCEWATLLDGREEGLYGWVTVNYLLDSLYPSGDPHAPAGIIDLGGGSVQIVYPTPATSSTPAGYSQELDFSGRKHNVYIKSHLGFGLDAARKAALDLLTSRQAGDKAVKHPCLPVGASLSHNGVRAPLWPRSCTRCLEQRRPPLALRRHRNHELARAPSNVLTPADLCWQARTRLVLCARHYAGSSGRRRRLASLP